MFVAFDKEDFEFVEVVEPAVDDKFFVAKLLLLSFFELD